MPKYNDYEVIELVPAESSSDDIVAQVKGDWMGSEETDRGRKAVRLRSVSEPISDALLVKGALDDKGNCLALLHGYRHGQTRSQQLQLPNLPILLPLWLQVLTRAQECTVYPAIGRMRRCRVRSFSMLSCALHPLVLKMPLW